MNEKGKNNRRNFFLTCVILVFLTLIFLFSGPVVNTYYQIQTPEPGNVIQSIPGFSKKALDPDSIKFLNWNVYKGSRPGWTTDFKTVSQGIDLILLQEVCLKNKDREVFGITGMGGTFARSFSYHEKTLRETGVMTLSAVRPLSAAAFLSRFKEPLTHTPKVSLVTEYAIQNFKQKLLVVNIHGINFVKSAAFKSQVLDLGKKINVHKGPVIFAGDFNTWNRKRSLILNGIIKKLGMKKAFFHPDSRTRRFSHFLDHVFYKGLNIKQTRIFDEIQSSDHKAMAVEFYFNPESLFFDQGNKL